MRLGWRGLAVAPLALATQSAAGLAAAEPEPRWEVDVSASTATPAVLPQGLSLGVTSEAERRFTVLPAFVSFRLGWTSASAANTAWVIDHHQFVAAAGAGISKTLGAGRLWTQVGGGLGGVYEVRSRHQRQRIQAANVPGDAERSFTVGPHAFAELGIGVGMRGPFSGFAAAGPAVFRTTVNGSARWRSGGFARLGVALAF